MTQSVNEPICFQPAAAALKSLIHSLPKAELHVHLEGSVKPETLRELARGKKRLQEETESWIRQRQARGFRYSGFSEFLEAFKLAALLLESPADYALATTRLLEDLAAENVRYAEITVSAGVILWKKQSLAAIFEAIAGAGREFESHSSLSVRWIFDAVRQFGAEPAREVLAWARIFRDDGVRAFGIGGDEERGPASSFVEVYREARDFGLRLTAHAGESGGPESVRQSVEALGAERIGHGLAAARDPAVMKLLKERQIPLEVCLTSNAGTGLIPSIGDHPLPQFLDNGLVVTINTDDPAMFATSLEREFALAAQTFSLTCDEVAGLARNAIVASFMPETARQSLLAEFDRAAKGGGIPAAGRVL